MYEDFGMSICDRITIINTLAEKLGDKGLEGISQEGICPITCLIMRDPVKAPDGHYFEREAIQKWYNAGNRHALFDHHLTLTDPMEWPTDWEFQLSILTELRSLVPE